MKSKKTESSLVFGLSLCILMGTSACPLQTQVVNKAPQEEELEAEMVWARGGEQPATRSRRKVKTYGEGNYGVEDPVTIPSNVPDEIDIELPPVSGDEQASRARARVEIQVSGQETEDKTLEASYLRENPRTGSKTKIRVRVKKLNEAVQGKTNYQGSLHVSLEKTDGRKIEFSFKIRSRPRPFASLWTWSGDEESEVEYTSDQKPIYKIAVLSLKNENEESVFAEFDSRSIHQAGLRIENIGFHDRGCPLESDTASTYSFAPLSEMILIVPEETNDLKNALRLREWGGDTQNRHLIRESEVKRYSVFAVGRKEDPSLGLRQQSFLGACTKYCEVRICEPTPGPRGILSDADSLLGCTCESYGWRKTPKNYIVGTQSAGRFIFNPDRSMNDLLQARFPDDSGSDQSDVRSLATEPIELK